MTSPQQSDQLTYQQALAAVIAAQAARSDSDTVATTTGLLAEGVIAARERATEWALNLIVGLWRDVDVYDGAAVQTFTEQAGQYMQMAQTTTAQYAAAAQVQILSTMGVRTERPTPSDPTDVRGTPSVEDDGTVTVEHGKSRVDYGDGSRVVDLDEDASTVGIFNRPARTQRYLEAQGMGSVEARAEAEKRMSVLVGDNAMLAQRLAEAEILAKAFIDTGVVDLRGRRVEAIPEEVVGYRRIIHPELSRTGVCGLCIAAADRIYRVRELRDVHSNCKCTIAAVTADFDPAGVLNKADFKQLYGLAGSTSGPDLKRVRYQTDEHGELGPVLVPKRERKPRKQFQPGLRTNDAPRRRSGARI